MFREAVIQSPGMTGGVIPPIIHEDLERPDRKVVGPAARIIAPLAHRLSPREIF
jgi:hypothetical protein